MIKQEFRILSGGGYLLCVNRAESGGFHWATSTWERHHMDHSLVVPDVPISLPGAPVTHGTAVFGLHSFLHKSNKWAKSANHRGEKGDLYVVDH